MASNVPLVVFRMLFGLLMAVECWGAIGTGWVKRAFVEPELTFPLLGFEPLRVLSGPGMYAYFAAMGAAALGVMLGYRYRWNAAVLALLWTGAYLAQKSHYNNHYYLAALVAWAMALTPAHRRASLDVRCGRVERTSSVPREVILAFRLQLWMVFTYAAIAKLYPGWLEGDYLRVNLGSKGDRWPLGALVVEPWFQSFTVHAAIVFDALVIPALLWRRTRPVAFAGLVAFDLFNSVVFRIGIFPYMVLAWTVFFFDVKSVERFFRRVPGLGTDEDTGDAAGSPPVGPRRPLWRTPLAGLLLVQLLLPLRHHLFPGDVNWTEEGHRMSWRMMLRTKAGSLVLVAVDRGTEESWIVDQTEFLTPRQRGRVAVMPEFLLQFARDLDAHYAASGRPDVAIFARSSAVSLNGGEPAPLFDPTVDLTEARWRAFGRDAWVLDRRVTR